MGYGALTARRLSSAAAAASPAASARPCCAAAASSAASNATVSRRRDSSLPNDAAAAAAPAGTWQSPTRSVCRRRLPLSCQSGRSVQADCSNDSGCRHNSHPVQRRVGVMCSMRVSAHRHEHPVGSRPDRSQLVAGRAQPDKVPCRGQEQNYRHDRQAAPRGEAALVSAPALAPWCCRWQISPRTCWHGYTAGTPFQS